MTIHLTEMYLPTQRIANKIKKPSSVRGCEYDVLKVRLTVEPPLQNTWTYKSISISIVAADTTIVKIVKSSMNLD
jgi:hypothetical protein